jgi:replicative DNA helicase
MARNDQAPAFRTPPAAIEVEKHILGGLMLDSEAMDIVGTTLRPQDFYLEKNSLLYSAIQSLHAARKFPDLLSISEELKRMGKFDSVGGDSYLMEISAEVVSSANMAQHAEIVKDKSLLRMVIATATRILEGAYDAEIPAKDLVRHAGEGLYRLEEAARGAAEGLVDMPTNILRAAHHFDQIAAGKSTRTRFGVSAIDDVTMGFRQSSVNILAARPGIGKSALALQGAVRCGEPVPIFSMEMLAQEEIERMMAHKDPSLNSDGVATQAQVLAKQQLIRAILEKLSKYPIEICDSSSVTIPFIQSETRRMKRKYGRLGMVMVDYLQMIESVGNYGRRDLEVASISGGLKKISNDVAAPVVAVASLSRKCEERDNKRPVESDLRDAGQIESDAHCIIFLYRESKYSLKAKKDDRIKNITEVSIPKNRGGSIGRTLLNFNGAMSWFFPVGGDDQRYYHNFLRGKDFLGDEAPKAAGAKGGHKKGKPAEPPADNWGDGDGAKQSTMAGI